MLNVQHQQELDGKLLSLCEQYSQSPYSKLDREIIDAMKSWICAGANVNVRDRYGKTPLHLSVRHGGSLGMIGVLIKNEANVNARDSDGNTPLHLAMIRPITRDSLITRDSVIKLLMNEGADFNIRNENNLTPLELESLSPLYDIRRKKALIECIILRNHETAKPDHISNNAELSEFWDNQVKKEIFLLNNREIFDNMLKHSRYAINRDSSLDNLISDAESYVSGFIEKLQVQLEAQFDKSGFIEYRADRRYPTPLKAALVQHIEHESSVDRKLTVEEFRVYGASLVGIKKLFENSELSQVKAALLQHMEHESNVDRKLTVEEFRVYGASLVGIKKLFENSELSQVPDDSILMDVGKLFDEISVAEPIQPQQQFAAKVLKHTVIATE